MNDTFLRACRGEEVEYTPVWLMRQAGRYLRQYQTVRANVDFLTLCKTPKLAAEVTIQPVEILGVDAAILFSDILIPVEAMGMRLVFSDKQGPILSEPIRNKSAVEKLIIPDVEEDMPFVPETIKILRKELENKVPLIGFSGAPFTLATYMIEGGTSKNFLHTKKMMFQHSGVFSYLMEKLTITVVSYLSSQIKAGAQAVQIFDTWAGMLTPVEYKEFALPYVKKTISELKKEGVPVIYFVNDCAGILKEVRKSGADVTGIDWRIDISDAIKRLGKKMVIQGNLDPCELFLPKEKLEERIKDILWKGESAKGHIFNLGHGVLPETPVENVIAMVEAVHKYGKKE
ncbi:MAG: uroporphyrinogen decarboxylase [Nitrospirae bacterium CG_4_10_14_0_8_um_filter_41_23]|nr:uroporphyrinogen decarboxylase [Nitrospirota bacterium]OIP59849.1 MAG: uroporphyrinogen decarboxylase [Nitrospirae bacterium CG2_30_41_42]PIQ93171.1 MAG: uroporphyrinogen decarboxylase [Nitrospirae bacterium CG11_big_fil_rev_8_21_14_0_20_41_14]PIV44755.1 MAG: uroporphyrinogen decarboxylase [Nitrospirae bacterium CG02_land_8_20_14_3_00_41_53]PIW87469.1 MAG: uroporphyrinogen decarboxylase [Nitrospirae bacterium CG_4_8_14_3_um_filter_41_47]PIY87903.1 MAG: uroporphyrinogen decarboxylase [Nitros